MQLVRSSSQTERTSGQVLLICLQCQHVEEFDHEELVACWPTHCGQPMQIAFNG